MLSSFAHLYAILIIQNKTIKKLPPVGSFMTPKHMTVMLINKLRYLMSLKIGGIHSFKL